ncbi:succinyldiaminopimelate transaminase [Marinobacteraceae bacterium S3BR75-40.1]
MNPNIDRLQPYPFEKLAKLKEGVVPPAALNHIALSIGEPKHEPPRFVLDTLLDSLSDVARYPATKGIEPLREAIADWATRRFQLPAGRLTAAEHILPVNGTREALFAIVQALVGGDEQPLVVSPNPFYQIYEGATLLAGAEPHFLPCTAENGWQPDFDAVPADVWKRCQLVFLCSPGNPTGALISEEQFQNLIRLADEHDFVICADECYSELYRDEAQPPIGLLQACASLNRDDFRRCLVFHSLSKRSNLPGLRSGFVAGDRELIARFLRYRTYHGCAMPLHHQHASIAAWNDEKHVRDNRHLYNRKFEAVLDILKPVLNVEAPEAGFYLWPETPVDDETFARDLFEHQNVTVLPGSYLSREINGFNPGRNRVRMALVAPLEECITAAGRIRALVESRYG